jgi:protein phosphatase 1 regulatory subunit 7
LSLVPDILGAGVLTNTLYQMSGNKIPDLTALDKELRKIETLRTLYLEANPCQTNDMANYRRKVMLTLPQLTQIDAT